MTELEKSEEAAAIILNIAIQVSVLDVEHCRKAANDMIEQASFQDTIAILNPRHSLINNDILRAKGKALKLLCDYADAINKIQEMNKRLKVEENNMDMISKLFRREKTLSICREI